MNKKIARWLALAPVVALSLPLLLATPAARAGAPLVKAQAPGFYRMMLGDIEVTVLSDGTVPLNVGQLLTNTTAQQVKSALARWQLADPVETSVNAFLVNTGGKLVLVDAGAGTLFGPTLGKMAANLKAAGYSPEQVDEIYITHMHPDHVGGLAADGKAVFPNAVVRADKREAAFWLDAATMEAAPAGMKNFFAGAQASLKPYVDAGRFLPFDPPGADGVPLVPGVKAVAAAGHTKGHANYLVEGGGRQLLLWGDTMHVAAVQFPRPKTTIQFDTDPAQALAARQKIFARAAKTGQVVGGSHLSFPGLGTLRAEGAGYVFQPVNYGVPAP